MDEREAAEQHLARVLDTSWRRLRELRTLSHGSDAPSRDLTDRAIDELATAIEELRVSREELHAQHAQLTDAMTDLALERQRYRDLFEHAPDTYVVTDERGIILSANRAAASLFGVAARHLAGKPLELYLPGAGARMRHVYAQSESARDVEAEWEALARPRGRPEVPVGVRLARVEGPDGTAVRWLARDLTERGRLENSRREMLRQLAAAEEQERLRLSRELHDQMGQVVTALQLGLKSLENDTTSVARTLPDLQQLADSLARDVADIAASLRPPALDRFGLAEALEAMVSEWSDRAGIKCDFTVVGVEDERFETDIETTLYRVVQEALTNVLKHARATRVSVLLERRFDSLGVIIEDDGIGFDTSAELAAESSGSQLGLRGMGERLAILDGTLHVESTAGSGTTVFARLPVS